MARKADVWRVASTGGAAALAAALIPFALSALASLPLDRAAHTAPLTTWAHSPLPTRWLTAVTSPATLILSLLLIAAIVAWWVWISGHLMRPRTSGTGVVAGIPRTAGRGEHGTSNLMTPAALETSAVTWSPGTTPVSGVSGFVIGATPAERGRKETYYLSGSEGHVLVIGSTGSGKTRRIVLPSIYALGELGESMVIPDPKGELYLTTCEHLKANGYRVDTIDLRDPSRSVQWSPLDLIVDLIWSAEIAHAEDMAHELAKTIVSAQLGGHGGNEAFWNASAEAIIAATALLIASEPKGVDPLSRNMFNVYRTLGTYGKERTAVRAGSLRQEQIYPLKEIIEGLDDRHPAKVAYLAASLATGNTASSMYTTAANALKIFSNRNMAALTARSEHNLADVGVRKSAVFIITPDERDAYNVMVTIYVRQLYQALVKVANTHGGRLPVPVNILFEEFGNIPKIPEFVSMLTMARSRGIRLLMVVQSIEQLERYAEGRVEAASLIGGNCSAIVYLASASGKTHRLISDLTGTKTIMVRDGGSSQRNSGGLVGASRTTSRSDKLTSRPVLMPDEIARLSPEVDGALVIRRGMNAALFPVPDLSRLSVETAFGLGDPERASSVRAARQQARAVHHIDLPPIWLGEELLPKGLRLLGQARPGPTLEASADRVGVDR
ncbi:MAG: type IV secretory system conjugative DNA transfer family protein [Coriobacteriia bacterium]|nr:type IV secretory system conjugative DNA transfer family protein [Coriobacteriia bacterium]